jgi:hypothetical protein
LLRSSTGVGQRRSSRRAGLDRCRAKATCRVSWRCSVIVSSHEKRAPTSALSARARRNRMNVSCVTSGVRVTRHQDARPAPRNVPATKLRHAIAPGRLHMALYLVHSAGPGREL